MADRRVLQGIYPALVSPVSQGGEVLEEGLRKLTRWLFATGCDGLYVCGGTGEGVILPEETRRDILAIVLEEARSLDSAGRWTIITHVGAADARAAARLARHAADAGAHAVSSIPPVYYAYGQRGVLQYYEWLAKESPLPVIIYASLQSGVTFTAANLVELKHCPGIAGLKFTSYNLYELMKMRAVSDPGFAIFNGADEILMFGLLAGADGGIGTTYNIIAREACALYRACRAGDVAEARRLQGAINVIVEIMTHANTIGSVKHVLQRMGFPVGDAVFPLNTLTEADRTWIDQQLTAIKFYEGAV
jgi:N-acetylneuraminate lyase